MARVSAAARRQELADRWRKIQEDEEAEDDGEPSAVKHRRLIRAKEEWYVRVQSMLPLAAPTSAFCGGY
jgi:hypothetical protein